MSNEELPLCPACQEVNLKAPGVCPSCGPLKYWSVFEPRVKKVVYHVTVWAGNHEQAIRIMKRGNSWPESYDEIEISMERGVITVEDVSDEEHYNRYEVGFPRTDPSPQEIEEFLKKGDPDE